jgi:hypothetical protein
MSAQFEQSESGPGREALSAADAAELMRWARRLSQAVRPGAVVDDSGLHARPRPVSAPFWARITGRDAMSHQYSWVEQRFNATTLALEDKPGGRSGTGGGAHPAIEANDAHTVPANARVLMHRVAGTAAYLFHYTAAPPVMFGCGSGYREVEVVTGVTCNGDGTISVTTETVCVVDEAG